MMLRKKKSLLEGKEAYTTAFVEMWSEENMGRMEDLGFYADIIKDEKNLIIILCAHLLDITATECRQLITHVPQAIPDSPEYTDLYIKMARAHEETDEPVTQLLHMEIINAVIEEYNKTAT